MIAVLLILLYTALDTVHTINIQHPYHNEHLTVDQADSLTEHIYNVYDTILNTQYNTNVEETQCNICTTFMKSFDTNLLYDNSITTLKRVSLDICMIIKPADCTGTEQCYNVCNGAINEYSTEVLSQLDDSILSPHNICHNVLHVCPATQPVLPISSGIIPVKSDIHDTRGRHVWPVSKYDTGSGYFIHLSDIHLDPLYTHNTSIDCGEPVCCHTHNGNGTAGIYGSYTCDTPLDTLISLLKHISTFDPQPDFVLYTGDSVGHNIWEQSIQTDIDVINAVAELLMKYVPDVPIYSTLGNHESYPVNQYANPTTKYQSWLYRTVDTQWHTYLATDARNTLKYAGYYQEPIRDGLRVISLNTNFYMSDNYYLWSNLTDYSGQIAWLIDVLQQCTEANEKVIIIGHSSPDGYMDVFQKLFLEIYTKYDSVILDHFYGHTHDSAVFILHDINTNEPLQSMYIAGSVTPYTHLNPGWRLYNYTRDNLSIKSHLVENYELYWINLMYANKHPNKPLHWDQLRAVAKWSYQLPNTTAQSWSNLALSWLQYDSNATSKLPLSYTMYSHDMFTGTRQFDMLPSMKQLACYMLFNNKLCIS